MSNGSRLLLIGLRGSGKTSYLAALWHLVEAGEIPASLTAVQLQPNREYLNRIRDSWLRFQELGRTPIREQQTVSLLLRDSTKGSLIDIALPDLSGESFRLQWTLRKATRHYVSFAENASGMLLFIHPDEVKRSALIPIAEKVSEQNRKDASVPDYGKPWTPDLSPTQVQLVEILQFVEWIRTLERPSRVAVVISAWDLVRDPVLPVAWLENRVPILH